MISKIYNTDKVLVKVGSRKGKTKEQIQSDIDKITNKNKKPKKGKMKPNPKYNFIDVASGYFRKGKYKDTHITKAPQSYLEWVVDNVQLNKSERRMIKNRIARIADFKKK